jgi:methionyl-tRNA synthetase
LQAAAPWAAYRDDPDRAAAIVRLSLNLVRLYAVLLRPYLTDAADRLLAALGLETADWPDDVGSALKAMPAGHRIATPDMLFAKISDEAREDYTARFAGMG